VVEDARRRPVTVVVTANAGSWMSATGYRSGVRARDAGNDPRAL